MYIWIQDVLIHRRNWNMVRLAHVIINLSEVLLDAGDTSNVGRSPILLVDAFLTHLVQQTAHFCELLASTIAITGRRSGTICRRVM